MTDVQRAARQVAADILTEIDHDDLEGRLGPGVTEAIQAAVCAEVREIGARLAPTT